MSHRSNIVPRTAVIAARMMSIDYSDQLRPPRRTAPKNPRRATPCAGLFGWRKDEQRRDRDDETPHRDYPAG
ncbi:hypothetical protein CD928_02600 [Sphingopyxis sp. GW247-27LB]|nr:hypothetical protein CD928_02600 [Sphingopyxis sp. GW247-27LB]